VRYARDDVRGGALPDEVMVASALDVCRQPRHFGRRQRRLHRHVVRRVSNCAHQQQHYTSTDTRPNSTTSICPESVVQLVAQQFHNNSYNKSNESNKCSNSISSICCGGFVGQLADATTVVVDKVKYTANVQQDNCNVYNKSTTSCAEVMQIATITWVTASTEVDAQCDKLATVVNTCHGRRSNSVRRTTLDSLPH